MIVATSRPLAVVDCLGWAAKSRVYVDMVLLLVRGPGTPIKRRFNKIRWCNQLSPLPGRYTPGDLRRLAFVPFGRRFASQAIANTWI